MLRYLLCSVSFPPHLRLFKNKNLFFKIRVILKFCMRQYFPLKSVLCVYVRSHNDIYVAAEKIIFN